MIEYGPTEITGGLVGLGLVVKGIVDHLARTRKIDAEHRCRCQFDPLSFDRLDLHLEKQDAKHDTIIEKLEGIERRLRDNGEKV